MKESTESKKALLNRRSFMTNGMIAAGAATAGTLLPGGTSAMAQSLGPDNQIRLLKGDVAILRFLAAAELIESDLWQQYAELGGVTEGTQNNYQLAFQFLDGDGPQYITSNTIDEISHATFLNGYLESKGADPVDFSEFETLQGSKATGAENIGRLTNLQHLNVDTSWYVRYRSAKNPDFGATFPQAIHINNRTAIPITDADFNNPNHIQVIANIAAFHFGYIEQGGASLYQALSQKVSSLEVLRITLGIGGDEVAHFLEWVDFAGNGVQAPVAPVSDHGLTFPDFFAKPPLQPPSLVQPSLIFPVPCEFISPKLPHCAVIRPSSDKFGGAVATIASFTQDGLFFGQSKKFFQVVQQLAEEADSA